MAYLSVEHRGPAKKLSLSLYCPSWDISDDLLIRSAVLLTWLPSKSNIRPTKGTLTSCPVTFLPTNYFHTGGEKLNQRFPASVWHSLSQPLFITLTVKAKYEHTYEYMNNWTSGYCYSPARTLPSLQSLLFGACSSAEHGLSDRMSEVGQRGVGAQVFLGGSFTEKEWPVSANAPSVCLRSFLLCPRALFLQWLPCWH